MHLSDFLNQPVNFGLVTCVVTLYGLVLVSTILQNAGLPDPVTGFGALLAEIFI